MAGLNGKKIELSQEQRLNIGRLIGSYSPKNIGAIVSLINKKEKETVRVIKENPNFRVLTFFQRKFKRIQQEPETVEAEETIEKLSLVEEVLGKGYIIEGSDLV